MLGSSTIAQHSGNKSFGSGDRCVPEAVKAHTCGREEVAPERRPLTSTCVPWCVHVCSHTQHHMPRVINKMKIKKSFNLQMSL